MENVRKVWVFLNNKKTTIGAALLFASLVVAKMAGIWEIEYDWIPKLVETLDWIGGVFTGIGLTHKGTKSIAAK